MIEGIIGGVLVLGAAFGGQRTDPVRYSQAYELQARHAKLVTRIPSYSCKQIRTQLINADFEYQVAMRALPKSRSLSIQKAASKHILEGNRIMKEAEMAWRQRCPNQPSFRSPIDWPELNGR